MVSWATLSPRKKSGTRRVSSYCGDVPVPHDDIIGCRVAHERLRDAILTLTDDEVRQRSLLPGWSVGHVLTHLARNGDSVVRRLDGAARGEVVDQYPGGAQARFEEIERGSGRSSAALIEDVVAASSAVDAAFESFRPGEWDRMARSVSGHEHPVAALPFQRWREVEVHLVDLGFGHTPADWPLQMVERWLPDLLRRLPERTDPRTLAAWTLRRGDPPKLDPY